MHDGRRSTPSPACISVNLVAPQRQRVVQLLCVILLTCTQGIQSLDHHHLRFLGLSYKPELHEFEQDISSNVGVSYFNGSLYATFRRVQFRPGKQIDVNKFEKNWINMNYLCTLAMNGSFTPKNCRRYDPIPQNRTCKWQAGSQDTTGIEDARLFVWPGRGLYTLFHAKPLGEGFCSGLLHAPYLALVKPEQRATEVATVDGSPMQFRDPWHLPRPILLHIKLQDPLNPCHHYLRNLVAAGRASRSGGRPQTYTHQAGASGTHSTPVSELNSEDDSEGESLLETSPHLCSPDLISVLTSKKQKNWAPFVHNNTLYFSVSFEPHVVVSCALTGRCRFAHVTSNSRLFAPVSDYGSGPRGNTPTILIPPAVSGNSTAFYLGIMHFKDRTAGYTNIFFKMSASPPFRIVELSSAIPLIAQGWSDMYPAPIAFPIGLDIMPNTTKLLVSYGSGDRTSRLSVFEWQDVMDLFTQAANEPPPMSKRKSKKRRKPKRTRKALGSPHSS